MHTKRITIKASGDTGQVEAVFSTLGVKDHDGDITVPGAFEDGAKVRISAYNHTSWQGALPVGKGVIHADQNVATLTGQFLMDTTHGRDTFLTVKAMEDQQEWSYGFDILDSSEEVVNGEPVRLLKKLKVHEVSPVLLGAGIGTRTLSVKSLDDKTDDELLADMEQLYAKLCQRQLPLPSAVVQAVHKELAQQDQARQVFGRLLLIAAAHGINTEGARA